MSNDEQNRNGKNTKELENELSTSTDIRTFLDENQSNFKQITLKEYIDEILKEKKLSKAEVIERSGLDPGYAYHIFAGRKNNPARNKILALALALELTPDETQRFLHYAGAAKLYVRDPWDSIIYFALENHLSVIETNELLQNLSQSPFIY